MGPADVRATVLALLLCAACGHGSSGAATALTFAAAAAAIQALAPPALYLSLPPSPWVAPSR